jgi:release factor glutamine methyltransferase
VDKYNESDAIVYEDIRLVIPPQVYSPAEDTDLCCQSLLQWAKNAPSNPKILEIGFGPGTLSLVLVSYLLKEKKEPSLLGIDLNPIAVDVARFNSKLNHLDRNAHFIEGDLFSPLLDKKNKTLLQGPFDLIFFNPPYLPSDEIISSTNRQKIDDAWDGGKKGDEITLTFLSQSLPYLHVQSQLIFISSSLVDQQQILAMLKQFKFTILQISKQHIFFEDILLYWIEYFPS